MCECALCVIYVQSATLSHTSSKKQSNEEKTIFGMDHRRMAIWNNNKNVPTIATLSLIYFWFDHLNGSNSFQAVSITLLAHWLVDSCHFILTKKNWTTWNMKIISFLFLVELRKNIFVAFNIRMCFFGAKWFLQISVQPEKKPTNRQYPCRVWDTLETKRRRTRETTSNLLRLKSNSLWNSKSIVIYLGMEGIFSHIEMQ